MRMINGRCIPWGVCDKKETCSWWWAVGELPIERHDPQTCHRYRKMMPAQVQACKERIERTGR